ncbi:MAG: trypsin-like peptidase domain-containing protein [Elusimicrobia bacterium]|nr:trypsin-like peptidase domain-containing protein [Elusimicrobiota bacterium]
MKTFKLAGLVGALCAWLGPRPVEAAPILGFEGHAAQIWYEIMPQMVIKPRLDLVKDERADKKRGRLLERLDRAQALLVERSSPSVVLISVKQDVGEGVSTGTGFIVDEGGLVVTAAHVVARKGLGDPVDIAVGGRELQAVVTAVNIRKDVAFLQLEGGGTWPALRLGEPGALRPGQSLMVLGHPLGLPFAASLGILSGKDRFIALEGMFEKPLQTDAAINPGNSGGPVLTMDGRVVGIADFIVSSPQGAEGLGFAVPLETLFPLLARHRGGQGIESGTLGVTFAGAPGGGPVIETVLADSAAQAVDLRPGDVVAGIDGYALAGGAHPLQETQRRLTSKFPGEAVTLEIERAGSRLTIRATMGAFWVSSWVF